MKILHNKKEMVRLFENHNSVVKSVYICDFNKFRDLITEEGYENFLTNEKYIEIPSNETKSGHAEILDW